MMGYDIELSRKAHVLFEVIFADIHYITNLQNKYYI